MPQYKNEQEKLKLGEFIKEIDQDAVQEKNLERQKNIKLCAAKARGLTEMLHWDQVLWAFNGKVFIDERLQQITNVYKVCKTPEDFKKVYGRCAAASTMMMAGPGNHSSSSNPQQQAGGTALGCVQSRSGHPVPSTTAAPGAASRTQPPAPASQTQSPAAGSRTQSPAAGGRAQSPATGSSTLQKIPKPTPDEEKEVAKYSERHRGHLYGMHTIWAMIRLSDRYNLGQKEEKIDILYDTGSTAQGVSEQLLESLTGSKNPVVAWNEDSVTMADGKTRKTYMAIFQLRLFTDPDRKIPMGDWFNTWGNIRANFALSGGDMRFRSGFSFANVPGVTTPLIVGKSLPAVIQCMYSYH